MKYAALKYAVMFAVLSLNGIIACSPTTAKISLPAKDWEVVPGGTVNLDGTVTFAYGGKVGEHLSFTDYEHMGDGTMALSLPRNGSRKLDWTLTMTGDGAVVWKEQGPNSIQEWRFFKTAPQYMKSAAGWVDVGTNADMLLLTFAGHPIRVGDSWTYHFARKDVEIKATLKSVAELNGRKVAHVELTGPRDFSGTSFSSNLVGVKSMPILCTIDVGSGLVVEAKGEVRQQKRDTHQSWNYVYDREFRG